MRIKRKNARRGFTLVEVLVAAAITSLSVIAVIVMIRAGEARVQLDRHRRAARGVIEKNLETPLYCDPNLYGTLPGGTTTVTIVDTIDKKLTPVLLCNLAITVNAEATITYNAVPVAQRSISFTASWMENRGMADSLTETVTVSKILANVPYTKQ